MNGQIVKHFCLVLLTAELVKFISKEYFRGFFKEADVKKGAQAKISKKKTS